MIDAIGLSKAAAMDFEMTEEEAGMVIDACNAYTGKD